MAEPWAQGANEQARQAWQENADFWDARMGSEGNSFVNQLIWPAVDPMVGAGPGMRILDAACGNGMYARRFARQGADVVAFDFSSDLIERARSYPPETGTIRYLVADATDKESLLKLGEGSFDAASCQMALFDMPRIDPLLGALARLLKPNGTFVASIVHPSFNQSGVVQMAESLDDGGTVVTTYSVKISRYMTPYSEMGAAIRGQPAPQPYFHRPLSMITESAFRMGFVIDDLVERAFPPEEEEERLTWGGKFSEIPPVLILRFRSRTC